MAQPHVIKPLTPETFPAWLALGAEAQRGVGRVLLLVLHGDTKDTVKNEYDGPAFKQRLVAEGAAHAALVFDGTRAMFRKAGFTFERHIGKRKTVMRISVQPR